MKTGILYFTPTPNLADRIALSARAYQERTGQAANHAVLSSKDVTGELPTVQGLTVEMAPYILRGHVWIGREREA